MSTAEAVHLAGHGGQAPVSPLATTCCDTLGDFGGRKSGCSKESEESDEVGYSPQPHSYGSASPVVTSPVVSYGSARPVVKLAPAADIEEEMSLSMPTGETEACRD